MAHRRSRNSARESAITLQLHTILRTHGEAYLASHPTLNRSQMKAWRAILACRTAALGGRLAQCDACGIQRHVYHSCRNRHCPQCQTRAKEAWIAARSRELLPVKALSRVFRGKFIAALATQRAKGAFGSHPASDALGWRALLAALYRHDWVVYAKQPLGGPAQVLDYLARYTHKTAISNDRLRGLHDGQVLFRVRDPARHKTGRLASLPAAVFIERFLSYVLPIGFKRIRHYGLLASRHKAEKLATCRTLLDQPAPVTAIIESVADFMRRVAGVEISRCTFCDHGHMQVIAALAPSIARRLISRLSPRLSPQLATTAAPRTATISLRFPAKPLAIHTGFAYNPQIPPLNPRFSPTTFIRRDDPSSP